MSFITQQINSAQKLSPKSVNKENPLFKKIKGYHWYQQYSQTPLQQVSIEEFEFYALNRLRRLRLIENGVQRGLKNDSISQQLFKGEDLKFIQISGETFDNQEDFLSHFILRIAFCRTEDLQRWFLSMETELYKLRLQYWWGTMQDQIDPNELFAGLNIQYEALNLDQDDNNRGQPVNSKQENKRQKINHNQTIQQTSQNNTYLQQQIIKFYKEQQRDSNQSKHSDYMGGSELGGNNLQIYKVPFEHVPELIAQRRVMLDKGKALITQDQIIVLVIHQFKEMLAQRLKDMGKRYDQLFVNKEKDRLVPIVENMHMRYLGKDYTQTKVGEVRIHDLAKVYKKSFPLCMQNLYEKVTQNGHLKHHGRQQLGLFLKGIGLPMEDALQFWRQCFSKSVGADKFEKEYAYNIRHNYGKEGKRTDYTPYSCQKVISMAPGVEEHHGCPYKQFNQKKLTDSLRKLNLGQRAIDEAIDKAKNNHYQISCGIVFEAVHKQACDEGITHPNKYFEESQRNSKGLQKGQRDQNINASNHFMKNFNQAW